MASKRSKNQQAEEAPTRHLSLHMHRLGLPDLSAYRDWCKQHGFTRSIHKSASALDQEHEQYRLQLARDAAATRRRVRTPLDAVRGALDGTFDLELIQQRELKQLCTALRELRANRPHRDQLAELFEVVDRRGSFLFEREQAGDQSLPYWRGVVALNDRRGQWRRPLADWRPRSHNRRKQFASLLRHDEGAHTYRDLFVHVGRGNNPRTARLPVSMTRKEAHAFLQAPSYFSIEGAIRWGQVHALGGDARLSEALAATNLGRGFAHESFWHGVIRWFANHPMLDVAQVGPLIDYIDHMKFRTLDVARPDGTVIVVPPPHPGFSMARRTPDNLLLQMERWHTGLGKAAATGPDTWPASGIPEFVWETGVKNKRQWRCRELRSQRALQIEGRVMGHCVSTYARSCAAQRCSIWTLELESKDGTDKRLTIEVSRQRVIVQARGKHNRRPESQELDVMRRWSESAEIDLAAYL